MTTATLPLGVTLNNPLNLRPLPAGRLWDGQINNHDTGTIGSFCNFKSPVNGFRAAMKNLQAYVVQGKTTPRAIINTWAPPSDNNPTSAYIDNVCKWAGFTADYQLNLATYDDAYSLLYAMTCQEQGSFDLYFKPWQLNEGLRLAGVGDVPVSGVHKTIAQVGAAVAAAATAAPEIQTAISSIAPNVMAIPSPTLHVIYQVVTVIAAVIGLYGLIVFAKRNGK